MPAHLPRARGSEREEGGVDLEVAEEVEALGRLPGLGVFVPPQ